MYLLRIELIGELAKQSVAKIIMAHRKRPGFSQCTALCFNPLRTNLNLAFPFCGNKHKNYLCPALKKY
jgi:hypothetical protein